MSGRPANAPAIGSTSKKKKALHAAARNDPARIAQIEEMLKAADFFDPSSLKTRKSRQAALDDYVEFCKGMGIESHSGQFNRITLIDTQRRYIAVVATFETGILEAKKKAKSLYQLKSDLYWWNVRFVDGFGALWNKWHQDLTLWIQQCALTYNMSTASYEKLNLYDTELVTLYQHVIKTSTVGVEYWQQHYVAWLLSYMTGVRPGSITVTIGYAAGDELPDKSKRAVDETLRWSDIEFFRMPDRVGLNAIATTVTFRYIKGGRDPHAPTFVDKTKRFTFVPVKLGQYVHPELDPSLVLLGLAIKRGLFTLDHVLKDDHKYLQKTPMVDGQAVFVQGTHDGGINVHKAMSFAALNPKLQDACVRVGLPKRNTMYSFRRAAGVDTRRKTDITSAREILGHEDRRSYYYYDSVEHGDVTAMRLGTLAMSKEDIDKMQRQEYDRVNAQSLSNQHGQAGLSLMEERNIRAEKQIREDPDWIKLENELKDLFDEAYDFLDQSFATTESAADQSTGHMQRRYNQGALGNCATLLRETRSEKGSEVATKLDDIIYQRKITLKKLRSQYRKEALEELAQEIKNTVKVGSKAATSGLHSGRGGSSKEMSHTAGEVISGLQQMGNSRAAELQQIASIDDAEQQDEELLDGVDIDAREQRDGHERENAMWDSMPDSVRVEESSTHVEASDGDEPNAGNTASPSMSNDDEDEVSHTLRLEFLTEFIDHCSLQVSGLTCKRCAMDPTVSDDARIKKYTRDKLDVHLKSSVHTRRSQLNRAFNNAKAESQGTASCPICPSHSFSDTAKFMKHLEKHHPELLWQDEVGEDV